MPFERPNDLPIIQVPDLHQWVGDAMPWNQVFLTLPVEILFIEIAIYGLQGVHSCLLLGRILLAEESFHELFLKNIPYLYRSISWACRNIILRYQENA